MRISDWSSDVCSSDLDPPRRTVDHIRIQCDRPCRGSSVCTQWQSPDRRPRRTGNYSNVPRAASSTEAAGRCFGAIDALYGAWACGMCLGANDMGLHHKLCHTLGGGFDLPTAELTHVLRPPPPPTYSSAVPDAP